MASLDSRGFRSGDRVDRDPSSPFSAPARPGRLAGLATAQAGAIHPELAFDAAVAIALSSGTLSRSGEADRDSSRFNDTSYVLMGVKGGTVQRIARADLLRELERRARINNQLQQYHLRFRPNRSTVLLALLAGFAAIVAAQGWMNMLNERRIAALEESYLEHQASAAGGEPTSDISAIETLAEFESRVMKARLDGCYAEAQTNLARAADELNLAMSQRGQSQANLQLANLAYEDYKLVRDSCRNSMVGLLSWLPSGK